MDHRAKMDPSLKHIFGDAANEQAPTEDMPERDLVGDLIHRQQFGVGAPNATKSPSVDPYAEKSTLDTDLLATTTPLTIPQIEKALETLREQIRNPALAKRFGDLPKLLKAARAYCEETDFAREFLEGAVAQDDARMRRAVKLLCQQHRDEILEANGSLEKLFGLN